MCTSMSGPDYQGGRGTKAEYLPVYHVCIWVCVCLITQASVAMAGPCRGNLLSLKSSGIFTIPHPLGAKEGNKDRQK